MMRLFVVLMALLTVAAPLCAAPVKLVVWGMESGAETKDFDAKVAAFERRNPDIRISALSMGAGAMNPQKLMTAIAGGVPPDLVRQDRFAVGDWASRGAFRPLDDLLTQDAQSSNPFAVRRTDYVRAAWDETLSQGKTYAIPDNTDDRMLYYNRTLFRQAGLSPPQTWDELISDAKRLTRRAPNGGYERLGFIPLYAQGWLYLWSWQNDGEALSPDGRRCTLANPQTTEALTQVVGWYDALGGLDAVNAFAAGFGSDEQDPFLNGQLAMKVDGDGFLNSIARYRPDLDFGVCPVPVPAARFHHQGRFAHDPTWVTWSGGGALAIPRGARHVREAWRFIQWLNSPAAAVIGANAQAAYTASKGRLYVPGLSANQKATAAVNAAFGAALPLRFREAKQVSLSLLPMTKFRPVTFVGQKLWDEQIRAVERAVRHQAPPAASLMLGQQAVQLDLDAAFQRDAHPLLPVQTVFITVGLLVVLMLSSLTLALTRWMRRHRPAARAEARAGLLFVLPWTLGFLALTLGPVLASLVLSFCDYDALHPARWAGLSNYAAMGGQDRPLLMKSLGNAAYLAAFGIPLGMVTGLGLALLLNAKIRGQRYYRTIFYLPSIVPTVAAAVLWSWLLNSDPNRGLVNLAWQHLITPLWHTPPPGWLAVPEWAKPGLILMGLWGAGGGMILWLAGLQAIPASLYEAAALDGAGGWAKFRHVTLPMLSPYIFFQLIMGTIGALQTFETAYILGGAGGGGSAGPDDSLLVPVVYLFQSAFQYFKLGYASALAWLLFIIILALTLVQLKLAPRWVHTETSP